MRDSAGNKYDKFEIRDLYKNIVDNLVDEYLNNKKNEKELNGIYLELHKRERLDIYKEACKHSASIIFDAIDSRKELDTSTISDIEALSFYRLNNTLDAALKADDFSNESLSMLQANNKVMIAKVDGDSMIDAGIYQGDEIIIDKKSEIKSNDIVVISIDDNFHIKRYVENNEGKWIVPENKEYDAVKITEDIHINFFGVVKSVIHHFNS